MGALPRLRVGLPSQAVLNSSGRPEKVVLPDIFAQTDHYAFRIAESLESLKKLGESLDPAAESLENLGESLGPAVQSANE
jgi:hypothetical protein